MDLKVILFAFLGGMLPAILWLWFWLKEDSAHPEPRGLVVITFIAGGIAVFFVLPVQTFFHYYLENATGLLFFIFAAIEELFKFLAAYIVALRSREDDEPIDAVIYMVTAALGFTAVENAFFLLNPLMTGNFLDSLANGNMRFVGASLLHVMTSAIVGISIAFSFAEIRKVRRHMILLGLVIATALHTIFNLSIMDSNESNTAITFLVLWFSVVGLLLFFEKIKRLNYIKSL